MAVVQPDTKDAANTNKSWAVKVCMLQRKVDVSDIGTLCLWLG